MPGDEISNHQAQSAGPSRWKKLFFALVVTVGFFLALEIVLAIAGVSPFIVPAISHDILEFSARVLTQWAVSFPNALDA